MSVNSDKDDTEYEYFGYVTVTSNTADVLLPWHRQQLTSSTILTTFIKIIMTEQCCHLQYSSAVSCCMIVAIIVFINHKQDGQSGWSEHIQHLAMK